MKIMFIGKEIPQNLEELSQQELKKNDEQYERYLYIGQEIGRFIRDRKEKEKNGIEVIEWEGNGFSYSGSLETGFRMEGATVLEEDKPDVLILVDVMTNSKAVAGALEKFKSIRSLIIYDENAIISSNMYNGRTVIPANSLEEVLRALARLADDYVPA